MTILEQYQQHFLPTYSNYPQGHYTTLFLLRQVESEAIFRTEGSGEPLNREFVHPGLKDDSEPIQRVVISKRKQTAVERRTGRELLRRHNRLFEKDAKSGVCALNRNNPCGKCMDCMIYGYAVGGGGAQKSRVITDDAFSLHPATTIVGTRQFNALFDNSTMRDADGTVSTSIGTDEYVKPESLFLDMETLKDVTEAEFLYILGNIMRSTRYGAISSRIGKVRNHLVGVIFSDCELFSNLEWTQSTYDNLRGDTATEPDFPLHLNRTRAAAEQAVSDLLPQVVGQTHEMLADDLVQLFSDLQGLYQNEEQLTQLLARTSEMYPAG